MGRIVVTEAERTLVSQARLILKLRDRKNKLADELADVTTDLTDAQNAMVALASPPENTATREQQPDLAFQL